MKVLSLSAIMLLTLISASWGQSNRPKTLDELVAYTGSDRQQILLEGAKAEAKVVWYTSLSGVYRELVDAFKRKYPAINIEPFRGGTTELGPRLLNEAQAGVSWRILATADFMLLRDGGLLKPFYVAGARAISRRG
jgi:ABC-type glycerol-3-phosphate transport system substrate-binding protein